MWNPFKKLTSDSKSTKGDEDIVAIPESFAWILGKIWWERKHPFGREDWHPSEIVIPEEWDAAFELSAWANQFATLYKVISNGPLGEDHAVEVLGAMVAHLREIEGSNNTVSELTLEMIDAVPVPADHPVFKASEAERLDVSTFGHAFGRANVAIEHWRFPDSDKIEALSRLGRCLIMATHSATVYFGMVTERLRLIESDPKASLESQCS
jgi:hypothetical protein